MQGLGHHQLTVECGMELFQSFEGQGAGLACVQAQARSKSVFSPSSPVFFRELPRPQEALDAFELETCKDSLSSASRYGQLHMLALKSNLSNKSQLKKETLLKKKHQLAS